MPDLYAVARDRRFSDSAHGATASPCSEGSDVVIGSRTQGPLRRTRVYIAGPMLGSGNPYVNVARGLDIGILLFDRGYAPYIPHLTAVLEMAKGMRTRDEWLELDRAFLLTCDCLLRLDGVSPGADAEVVWAREAGITVHYSLDMLFACEKETR